MASDRYRDGESRSVEYSKFPEIKEKCPICGEADCARWKGYYLRNLNCFFLVYFGKVAIHCGECRDTGKNFSFLPDFMLPYRRISRLALMFLFNKLLEFGKLGKALDETTWGLEEVFLLSISTAYSYIECILSMARIHRRELGMDGFVTGSLSEYREFMRMNTEVIENFFFGKKFHWNTAFQSNLSPPELP